MNKVKYLLTYRYAEIIHDLTVEFCLRYLRNPSNLSNLGYAAGDRTTAQMTQAARSGKQNIVEGVSEIASLKSQIKLLGVSLASFEELITDCEDFLRQHGLEIYPKTHPKIASFKKLAYRLSDLSNLSNLGNLIESATLPGNPTDDANFLLTLCHIETYLLSKQIKAAEEKFIKEGGYTENLFKKRLKYLKQSK